MKKLICTLCQGIPSIKINVLNYCKECFTKQVESKIHKNLRNIPYQSRVLIIFNESQQTKILLDILDNLKNKKMHKYQIFNGSNLTREYDFIDIQSQLEDLEISNFSNDLENSSLSDDLLTNINKYFIERPIVPSDQIPLLIKTITSRKIDVVLFCKSVEDICIDLFTKISSGESIDETDVTDKKFDRFCLFINMFKDVKNKEIQYYSYIKNIKSPDETYRNNLTKKRISIKRFIQEIDRNNPLALFNIINTVKKIIKK